MQIRIRKGRVECLRATWDPEAKRSRQKIIKSTDFTPEERAQFEAWKAERDAQEAERAKASAASVGAWSINRLAEAVEGGHTPPEPQQLLAALDRLNKALRKQGVKRPPREAKVHRDEKTQDLLSNQPAS